MSVNTNLLPVTETELRSVLGDPESLHRRVAEREADVCSIGPNAQAIMLTIAERADDPLLFLEAGGPPGLSGWVGEYVLKGGKVIKCEVDMGYGPASYYRNTFIIEVAERLQPWTVERFSEACDLDLLEDSSVYPLGWHVPGRREELVAAFGAFRDCILSTASVGRHLIVWSA